MYHRISTILLVLSAYFCAHTAYAEDSERIKELEDRVMRLEALLQKYVERDEAREEEAAQNKELLVQLSKSKNNAHSKSDSAHVTLGPGPRIQTSDGEYSFRLTGRLMADAGWYDDDGFDYADGTTLRRLWVGLEGHVGKDWFWRAEPDFANDTVVLRDGYLRYMGFEHANIAMGQQLEPFGMSALTSSKYLTFIERGLPFALQPDRRIGIRFDSKTGDDWAIRTGFFGSNASSAAPNDDEGYSFSIRGHKAPILDDNHLLHLGAAFSYRTPDGDMARYRSRPEAAIDDNNIVDTGLIQDVENIQLYGGEIAGMWGPAHMQAEYNLASLDRDQAAGLDFETWYVNLGLLLTGDRRSYNPQSGVFGRINPKNPFSLTSGGIGAWEIAARYSSLDLNDADITGGKIDDITLGVNWYPNNWTKFMFNYIKVDGDEHTVTAANDDPDILLFRSQVEF